LVVKKCSGSEVSRAKPEQFHTRRYAVRVEGYEGGYKNREQKILEKFLLRCVTFLSPQAKFTYSKCMQRASESWL